MQFVLRQPDPRAQHRLQEAGTHPLLAQLFAARGVKEANELELALPHLLPPALLKGAQAAAVVLADAIARGERLLIVADYDCDGATACAVGLRGLRAMGAAVEPPWPPFSTITATAIVGASAGAKAMNRAWSRCFSASRLAS